MATPSGWVYIQRLLSKGRLYLRAAAGERVEVESDFSHTGSRFGIFNRTPTTRPIVTATSADPLAIALANALDQLGIIQNNSSVGGTLPAPVSNLNAVAVSTSQINLSWAQAAGATGYMLHRSLTNGFIPSGSTLISALGNVASYIDAGVASSTTYYYRIISTNNVGQSSPSNQAVATTGSGASAPSAPSNLNAFAVSNTQINLTWSDNSNNESAFHIERAMDSGGAPGTWQEIAAVGANAQNYSNTGLSAGQRWHYRVRASNESGFSGFTNTAATTTMPTAPVNLVAVASGTSQINLTWSTGTGAASQEVHRSTTFNFTATSATLVDTLGSSATSYPSGGLAAGTTYHFRIVAVNAGGAIASGLASATTGSSGTAPTADTISATAMSSSQINISITAGSNATARELHRSTTSGFAPSSATKIADLQLSDTSYTDMAGLAASTTYHYRTLAINANGSAQSAPASATTFSSGGPTLFTAGTAALGSVTSTSVAASASAPTGGTTPYTYQWVRKLTTQTDAAYANVTGATGLSMTDTTVVAGTSYNYRLGQYDATGSGVWTNVLTANVPAGGTSNKMGTLTDAFTGSTIDTNKWTVAAGAGWTISQNNELVFTHPGGSTAGGAHIRSNGTYDLADSHLLIEVPQVVTASTTHGPETDVRVRYLNDSSNSLRIRSFETQLQGLRTVGGTITTVFDITYSATAHRWWRIRASGAVTYFETSPDTSTWTVRGQWTHTLDLSAMQVLIYCAAWLTPPATTARFDNLNLPTTVATAPTADAISASATSSSAITVSITPGTGATSKTLHRSTTNNFTPGAGNQIDTLGTSQTSYADSGLTASTTYYYKTVATNAAGSTPSNQASATTSASSGSAPTADAISAAVTASSPSTAITVTITPGTGATSKTLHRSTTQNFAPAAGNQIATLTTSQTSYGDTSLTASTTYYYRTVSTNTSGSTPSNQASATTQAATPTAVSTNFSEYATGALPAELPATWAANGNINEIVADAAMIGGKALRFGTTGATESFKGLRWTKPGETLTDGTFEAELLVETKASNSARTALVIRGQVGAAGAASGYFLRVDADDTWSLRSYTNDASVNIGGTGLIVAATAGSRVRLKLQAQGTTIRAKVWAAASAEPGAWTWEVTNTLYASGFVGFMSYRFNEISRWDTATYTPL